VALGLITIIASGLGLHYLEQIRVYQLQFEDEWEDYQRIVFAKDILKEISTDISAWQAGILPVAKLKLKSDEITRLLSSWASNEQKQEKRKDLLKYKKQEAQLLTPARAAYIELIQAIAALRPKPTTKTMASLILSLDKLQEANQALRQFYFDSIKRTLARVKKGRYKAHRDSIYFILIAAFFIFGISTFSIKVLQRQAKQLMEQERQIALVSLIQQLAHEIRNPLGIVKSAASVIARRSTGEVVTLARDISSEVERVDRLLTDLLHLRRAEVKPKESTDISALVLDVTKLFSTKISATDLRLEVYNKTSGVLLPCQPEAIKQVLMNLLLNAIEASNPKGAIEITMMVVGREFMLQVRDHGSGIDLEEKRKIFDLMYTTKPYGFGIGLTVVKRIVEDHGGRIEVSSPAPRGTAFTIYLPMES
jgi:signal transduction histidine kinase